MHIEIEEKAFALHWGRVKHAIASKSSLVACTALTIEVTGDLVVFKACDLAMEIVSVCDRVKVIREGTISIIEKEIPKIYGLKSIQVPEGSSQAWFYCETGKTRVGLLKEEDYPQIANFENNNGITLPVSALIEGFEAVEFAATRDEYKQTWASIYLEAQENFLRFIAGESSRIAIHTHHCQQPNAALAGQRKAPGGLAEEPCATASCMIASSAIKAVISFLKDSIDTVDLVFDQGFVKIKDVSGGFIVCRTLIGQYPAAIMPQHIENIPLLGGAVPRKVIFSVPELLKVLEILEPSAIADANRTKLTLNTEEQVLRLWAIAEGKESYQEIPAVIQGEGLEVCINFSYLLSNLKNLKDKEGVMEFFGDRFPFFLRPNSDKDLVILTAVMASVAA